MILYKEKKGSSVVFRLFPLQKIVTHPTQYVTHW